MLSRPEVARPTAKANASSIKAKLIDIVGVWGGWAPQSQLLGASLDLSPALLA